MMSLDHTNLLVGTGTVEKDLALAVFKSLYTFLLSTVT